MDFHAHSIAQTLAEVKVQEKTGLSTVNIPGRQVQGKNTFPRTGAHMSRVAIFLNQWKSPLIIILVIAATVSGLLGERIDMLIIYITAFINAFIGFFQEYKANAALERLQTLVSFYTIVLRDGEKQKINSEELVIGDIVYLEAGDTIPADGRVLRAQQLSVSEAALTGESAAVKKQTEPLDTATVLAERTNMVFKGTSVSDGVGTFVVTAIGSNTELGKIATLVKETKNELTPLQLQLSHIAKKLSIVIVVIALGIFILGLLFGADRYTVFELFETAIAVAVAAIPEGLVISLTVILAIGMQFILQRHALVRRLVAAETLGSVSVICTDKTGTLTEGNMSVVRLYTAGAMIEKKEFSTLGKSDDAKRALDIGVLCNNAIEKKDDDGVHYIGDTTETALLLAADAASIDRYVVEKQFPRIDELPFSSASKYMATVHTDGDQKQLLVKGAPEVILEKSTAYLLNGKEKKLTQKQRTLFAEYVSDAASHGFRTLALAYRRNFSATLSADTVDDLVIVGIVAIADPVRREVKDMIALAEQAGIRVIMITGDHASTATAVARELGLIGLKENGVCEGKEIDTLSQKQLMQRLARTSVFARVAPEHKIRIVQALQAQGEVVAMTGDGVNDAPAIKGADIGIAVGSGSDVAKETADMVLLDDSFSTIVAAVEEGRGIYKNIKKIVLYLLSSSFAEVVMITGSILAGLPVAALPAQILWVNVLQDSFPTMALAFDTSDNHLMSEPPRKKNESLVDKDMKIMILLKSIFSNIILFLIFLYLLHTTADIALTRTVVFVGFAVDALFYIFSIRSLRRWIWQFNPFSNRHLIAAVLFGWGMLVAAIYWAPLQTLLRTVPLSIHYWIMMICFGIFNLILMEMLKGIFFMKKQS